VTSVTVTASGDMSANEKQARGDLALAQSMRDSDPEMAKLMEDEAERNYPGIIEKVKSEQQQSPIKSTELSTSSQTSGTDEAKALQAEMDKFYQPVYWEECMTLVDQWIAAKQAGDKDEEASTMQKILSQDPDYLEYAEVFYLIDKDNNKVVDSGTIQNGFKDAVMAYCPNESDRNMIFPNLNGINEELGHLMTTKKFGFGEFFVLMSACRNRNSSR